MASLPIPHWPGIMKRALAARYCDLTTSEFEREIAAGRLPLPIILGDTQHWSKASLDKAVAILTGEEETDWRNGSPLYRDVA